MQSRFASFVESLTNTFVGLVVSFFSNMIVLPIFGMYPSLFQALGMTVAFTFISIVRSYLLRRLFNGLRWGNR